MPPSSEPIRQRIIDAMEARFGAINGGSTYWHDLSAAKVSVWNQAQVQNQEMPYINILDGLEPTETETLGGGGGNRDRARMQVEIHACAKAAAGVTTSKDLAKQARRLQADLLTAVGVDQAWGEANCWTKVLNKDIDVQKGEQLAVWAFLQLEVAYSYPRFNYSA
jgi:hypothetical protein